MVRFDRDRYDVMGSRADASFLADTSMGEADTSMGLGLTHTPGMGASLAYNVHGTPSVQDDGWGASNRIDWDNTSYATQGPFGGAPRSYFERDNTAFASPAPLGGTAFRQDTQSPPCM